MDRPRQHAQLLLQQGRYDLALEAFQAGLADDAEDLEAHHGLAWCLLALDRPDEAATQAETLLGLAPDLPDAQLLLARIRLTQHRSAAALELVTAARGLAGEDVRVDELTARIHIAENRWREALTALEAGLRLEPDDADLLNLRSLVLTRLGRRDDAEADMVRSLHLDPEDPGSHAQAGWNLLHAGSHREARRHFLEALRLQPGNEYARAGLVEAIKAGNPLYRWIFRLLMRLESLRARTFMIVMVASVVVRYGALQVADRYPAFTVPANLLVFSIFGLFMALMIAPVLANAALLVHPVGRHALTRRERLQALILVAGLLPILAGLAALIGPDPWRTLALVGLLPAVLWLIPLTRAATPQRLKTWSRAVLVVLTVAFALLIAGYVGIEHHRQVLVDESDARLQAVGINGLDAIHVGMPVTSVQNETIAGVMARFQASDKLFEFGTIIANLALWGLVAFTWLGGALTRPR